jgi:hypothetical protein
MIAERKGSTTSYTRALDLETRNFLSFAAFVAALVLATARTVHVST